MNLFIGLLNMAIEDYNKHEEFLLLKAQVFILIVNNWLFDLLNFLCKDLFMVDTFRISETIFPVNPIKVQCKESP